MWQVIAFNGLANANGHMGRDAETLEGLAERDRTAEIALWRERS